MDQKITAYIDALVLECLNSPAFANLIPEQKDQIVDQIESRLYGSILDLVVDHLSDEQVTEIEKLDPNSQEMEDKIEEFSASVPGLAGMIESRLNQEVDTIRHSGLS